MMDITYLLQIFYLILLMVNCVSLDVNHTIDKDINKYNW